jgi:hypothetical protein
MKFTLLFLLFLIFGNVTAEAETIWCKTMKIGCSTQEDRDKAMRHCERMANDSYRQGLIEASTDPTIWQFAGLDNAYAYANMRGKLMMSICVKNTPLLKSD